MKEELYSLPGGEAEAAAPGDEAQPMDTYDENAQDCYTESATEGEDNFWAVPDSGEMSTSALSTPALLRQN